MAAPASLFRPGTRPGPVLAVPVPLPAPEAAGPGGPAPVLLGAQSAGAVEFDTVISASGVLGVLPAVQRIRMGAARAGQFAHVWADEFTVHVLIGGQLVKTVPSSLDAEDLATLKMRGASPAGPPPAALSPAKAGALPGGTVIEVDWPRWKGARPGSSGTAPYRWPLSRSPPGPIPKSGQTSTLRACRPLTRRLDL